MLLASEDLGQLVAELLLAVSADLSNCALDRVESCVLVRGCAAFHHTSYAVAHALQAQELPLLCPEAAEDNLVILERRQDVRDAPGACGPHFQLALALVFEKKPRVGLGIAAHLLPRLLYLWVTHIQAGGNL